MKMIISEKNIIMCHKHLKSTETDKFGHVNLVCGILLVHGIFNNYVLAEGAH